jgi:hypothetical protein
MGILSKLFGGRNEEAAPVATPTVDCPHTVLIPRWDRVEDMGDATKVVSFTCEACGESLEPGDPRVAAASNS